MFRQKYFKELRRYHAMIQHLSMEIPEEALQDQEEVEHLVSELVHQALGQGVYIQHYLEVGMEKTDKQIQIHYLEPVPIQR